MTNETPSFSSKSIEQLFYAIVTIGALIPAYQVYNYLKAGYWQSISIIDALKSVDIQWAVYPQDWVGLWSVLDFVPLSIFILFLGIAGASLIGDLD